MENFWLKIRNAVNNTVKYYGTDKVLHFLVGAWLTSLVTPLGFGAVLTMFIFVTVISYIKELYVDSIPDKKDFYAGVSGSLVAAFIWLLLCLIA